MIRGWYTGASGMLAQQVRLDAIANNLSNVNTNAYKRDIAVQKAVPELLIRRFNDNGVTTVPFSDGSFASIDKAPIVGTLGTGVELNQVFTIHQQGSLRNTNAPLDLAITGDGFFVVETEQGPRLTRDGNFTRNNEGIIVNSNGYALLDTNDNPMELKAYNFRIDRQGRVYVNPDLQDNPTQFVGYNENSWDNEVLLHNIQLVDVDRRQYLQKQGSNLWNTTFDSGDAFQLAPEHYNIEQGFIEAANVNPIREMVELIEINRAYEANQRVVQSHDESTGRLLSRVLVG